MRKKRKEFSVLKWIIFPLNSVVLAAIVAYFNITVFGVKDGVPYTAIVCLIGVFSILINKYTESDNYSLAKAAFIFEIVLTTALIVNACYSVSVQRKMSVARMAESSQKDTIGEIAKLRGSKTQQAALDKVDKPVAAQSVFGDVENILFWIMAGELALYGLSAFTLFALAKLVGEDEDEEEFPDEIEVKKRVPIKREDLRAQKDSRVLDTAKTLESFNPEGLERLREALRDISFRVAGYSFKSHVKDGAVWVRMMKAVRGTQQTAYSAKLKLSILDDALRLERNSFRERLETCLRRDNGFPI